MAYSSVKTFGRRSSSSKFPFQRHHDSIEEINYDERADKNFVMDKLRIEMVGKRWESFFRQGSSSASVSLPRNVLSVRTYTEKLRELNDNWEENSKPGLLHRTNSLASITAAKAASSLLKQLKEDLSMASSNFRVDFIQQNGISMLCGALKKLQEEINVWENADTGHEMDILKNKMVDEFHCIMCVKFATRDVDGCNELLENNYQNLETVCQSLLSPCMQSRIAVMDLLTNLLNQKAQSALRPVLQQFSLLRLRYAQQDRFRFLVGMSQSSGKLNLLFKASLLGMMNEMLMACPTGNYQVYLQTELEEAGLNVDDVEKTANLLKHKDDSFEDATHVVRQVSIWRENYIMVDKAISRSPQSSRKLKVSPTPSLPKYEYGTASSASLASASSNHTSISPLPPPPILPRTPTSTGEIKVIIKSISPSQSPEDDHVSVDIHPPPPPPPPPPKSLSIPPYSQNPMHRQLPQMLVSQEPKKSERNGTGNSTKFTIKSAKDLAQRPLPEVPTKFGAGSRQMQSSNLNQRMADKFSSEYNDWRRKRSGDSVESADSSDSSESTPDFRGGAVYLVDGVYPAQKALIDDVLLQFDRAYDALDDRDCNK